MSCGALEAPGRDADEEFPAPLLGADAAEFLQVGVVEQRQAEIGQGHHVHRLGPAVEAGLCRMNVAVGIAAQHGNAPLMQPGQTGGVQPGAALQIVARAAAAANEHDVAQADLDVLQIRSAMRSAGLIAEPVSNGPPFRAATSRSTPRPTMPLAPVPSMPSLSAPSGVTSRIG